MGLFGTLFGTASSDATPTGGLFSAANSFYQPAVQQPPEAAAQAKRANDDADRKTEAHVKKRQRQQDADVDGKPSEGKRKKSKPKHESVEDSEQPRSHEQGKSKQKTDNKATKHAQQQKQEEGTGTASKQTTMLKKPSKKERQQDKQNEDASEAQSSDLESEQETEELEAKADANNKHRHKKDSYSDSEDSEEEEARAKAERIAAKKTPKRSPEEEQERLIRTLFVGNLPASTSSKALKKLFAKYGAVESVRIRSIPIDPNAKGPRRAAILTKKVDADRAPAIAYVVYTNKADADKALELNMTEFNEHHINVDHASAPRNKEGSKAEYDPARTLFCGNLHFLTTNEELIQFFSSPEALDGNPELDPVAHGGKSAVEAVRIVRDPATSIGKGFAFVLFRTKAAVRAGLSLNGKELRKRAVRLTRVSVQQQKKVRMAREASQPPSKKPPHKSSSPAGRPDQSGRKRADTDPSSWQGTQTKGKGKGVRGMKLPGVVTAGGPGPKSQPRTGKRPSVAARKAASKKAGKVQGGVSKTKAGSGGPKKKMRT